MRFPRKVNYCLLAAITMLTLIIRYPLGTEHEMGSDTTFIHTMANSLAQEGYAKWILHPTSHFGLYALSYPSAGPFILSSGYQVSRISVEGMILLLGLLLSVVGAISAYLVGKLIRDDDVFAHSIALLFTIAPFYVKDTTWVASSRGFVVALLPFFLLLLMKHLKTRDTRYLLLSFAVFVVLGSLHRMGLLTILIIIAYLLAIPLHLVTQRLRFSLAKFEKPFRVAMVALALATFLSVFYLQFLFPGISGANVVEQYERGAVMSGTSFQALLFNMGVSLVGRVGLILPLVPVGLVAYAWKRPKESTDKFFLLAAFSFIPLLSLRDYIAEFLIPVFVVLAVIGSIALVSMLKNRRKVAIVLLAGILVASVAFSWPTKDRWRNIYDTDKPIPHPVYDIALYIRSRAWGTIVTNAGLTGGRIAAISNLPNMPLGGASTHFRSTQQLMWNFVNGENLPVRLIDLMKISFNTDEIYVPLTVDNAEQDWEKILAYQNPYESDRLMDKYDVHFVVTENSLFPYYSSYGYSRPSCLLGDDQLPLDHPGKKCREVRDVLPNNNYVIFSNSLVTLWLARGGTAD